METPCTVGRRSNRCGMEENVLAILDAPGCKDTRDSHDDRIAFLEAVRAACVVNRIPPTTKMRQAVFQTLRAASSLELIVESYHLLSDLDKCFPRVFVAKKGKLELNEMMELEEAWSPFRFNLDVITGEKEAAKKSKDGSIDSLGFHHLIHGLGEVVNGTNLQALETRSWGNMMLFQYLVNFLEGDFVPRNKVYEETMNWTVVRESLLSVLLSSRRVNYKVLMKNCLAIMCGLCEVSGGVGNNLEFPDDSVVKLSHSSSAAVAFALHELRNNVRIAGQKLLTMIMELDTSRKIADMQGSTTRADGVRIPLVEIIVDELTYGQDMIFPFLQIFDEPKWKLEIILQYFSKYTAKPPSRTRRSNGSREDATFSGVLRCFSNITSTRSFTKKMGADVVQVLLAHAFQAHLLLTSFQQRDLKDEDKSTSIEEICEDIISAFNSLRKTDEKMEILPLGKEALVTAATILSTNSCVT